MAWIEPDPKKHPSHKGPWYVRYREAGVKQRSGPFYHLPDAKDEEAKKVVAEREAKKRYRSPGGAITHVETLWKMYLTEEVNSGNLKPTTAYQKKRMLGPYLGKYETLHDLTGTFQSDGWGKPIHELKTCLLTEPSPMWKALGQRHPDRPTAKPYSSTTASIILRALQTFLEWCKIKRFLPANPMDEFPMPKSKERSDMFRDKQDREKILDAAIPPSFRLYLVFQALQGQRRSTTLTLEGHHLDLKKKLWKIPAELTKEGYAATVPLNPRVVKEIKELFPEGLPNGRLFEFTNRQITHLWFSTRKKAALPYHITLHGFRRTWASGFMDHTQNLRAVMQAGLWKDVKTAMKYQHIQAKWLHDKVEDFDF